MCVSATGAPSVSRGFLQTGTADVHSFLPLHLQSAKTNGIEAALAELDMDHYDSEDEGGDDDDMGGEGSAAVVARALGGRSAGIVLDDPYLAATGDSDDEDGLGDLDSEDRDDYVLRDTDLLVLAARTEDDVSTLEVWVYEEASSSTGMRLTSITCVLTPYVAPTRTTFHSRHISSVVLTPNTTA